jgi:hypothetical protein
LELNSGTPFKLPINEKGRYIFPYPFMAVVLDSGINAADVRISIHPPPERGNLILQATVGSPRPDGVKEDILLAKKHYGDKPRRIFLAGNNNIKIQTNNLLDILNLCSKTFPSFERVSFYEEPRFLLEKGADELTLLSQAGLKKIYMRLYKLDDRSFLQINLDATSKDNVSVAEMTRNAGVELSVSVMLGIGGAGKWKENAVETARVLNRMKPPETRLNHLIIQPDSILGNQVATGEFKEATRYEMLKEMHLLITLLNYETNLHTHRLLVRGPPIERKMCEKKEETIAILEFALNYFFGEAVDNEKIKGYSVSDILEWDGYIRTSG